jgi:hypothetical protein
MSTAVPAIRATGEPRDGRLSSFRQRLVHGIHRSFPRAAQCPRSCASSECSAWRKCRQQLSNPLADVGLLFSGLAATLSSNRAEAYADTKERRSGRHENPVRATMRSQVEAIHRIARAFLPFAWVIEGNRPCLSSIFVISCFCVTSCATPSHHKFSDPSEGWQTRTGQLMYRTPKTTLIGDALVRFSKTGDFELTVSKGSAITLLSLREDATFAEVKGAFARQGWSGPVEQAPPQLRGWLGLRDQFVHARDQKTLRYVSGNETFLFRF